MVNWLKLTGLNTDEKVLVNMDTVNLIREGDNKGSTLFFNEGSVDVNEDMKEIEELLRKLNGC